MGDRTGRTIAVNGVRGLFNKSHCSGISNFTWYQTYMTGSRTRERLKVEAREVRIGLQADTHPITPYVLRKARVPSR
ncbi:MAG TPA: hypothetical protein VN657_03050 [Nitrospiraceae bacterium]|nr:hypothetical protein [Nitrospiraceae bacterium]